MPSISVKRGTEAALLATNPVVASGELIYSTDTFKLKVGDGISSYSGLPTVGSGIYAPINSPIFSGLATFSSGLTSTTGNFTTSIMIGNNTINSGIALNIINSSNLYLWSNFR